MVIAHHSERRFDYWLFGILLLGLALRLIFFQGIHGDDDLYVASFSLQMMEGTFGLPDGHYGARVGLSFPSYVIFSALGVGEWQLSLFPIFMSMLGIAVAYLLGREIAGETVGRVAALTLALFPLDVGLATTLGPDSVLGALFGLAFYLSLRALKAENPYGLAVAAGLVWAYAYFVKIEAAFMLFPLAALFLARPDKWRVALTVAVACGIFVIAENLYYYGETGELFYRLKILGGNKLVDSTVTVAKYGAGQLWIFPKSWFVTFYQFGFHYYLFFSAMIWVLFTKQKNLYIVVFWSAVYLAWLQFGFNPLSENWGIKSHLARYCAMMNVPMSILVGAFLVHFYGRLPGRLTIPAAGVLVFVPLFFLTFNILGTERQQATKQAIRYAQNNDLFPLYLDGTSHTICRFLMYGDERRSQVFPLARIDREARAYKMIEPREISGFMIYNEGFVDYASKRYSRPGYDLSSLRQYFETVYSVSNPSPAISYAVLDLLDRSASLIPIAFIRESVHETAQRVRQGDDSIIMRRVDRAQPGEEENGV